MYKFYKIKTSFGISELLKLLELQMLVRKGFFLANIKIGKMLSKWNHTKVSGKNKLNVSKRSENFVLNKFQKI